MELRRPIRVIRGRFQSVQYDKGDKEVDKGDKGAGFNLWSMISVFGV